MPQDTLQAYQKAQLSGMSPRQVEAMAFMKAARLLEEAKEYVSDVAAFAKSVRFNHLLWTIMQADITEPENKLPPEIQANIMSLSIFVDKQTMKALRTSDPKDLDILININRNIAAGLNDNVETAADGVQSASAEA